MIGDINLIPQNEVVEQKRTQAVKSSTIVSFVILLISILVSLYYFVTLDNIRGQISKLENKISTLRSEIENLSEVEITARNLNKKYTVLERLFYQRPKYSLLLSELRNRKPAEVAIESLEVGKDEISVSGSTNSYLSVADFVQNLIDTSFGSGDERLKELFTSVSLNSVNLDKGTGSVKFFVVVSYNEDILKGK